jgi:hypothetical protein
LAVETSLLDLDEWDDSVPESQFDNRTRKYDHKGSRLSPVEFQYKNNNNYERTKAGGEKYDFPSMDAGSRKCYNKFAESIFSKNNVGAGPRKAKGPRETIAERMKRIVEQDSVRVTIKNGYGGERVVRIL